VFVTRVTELVPTCGAGTAYTSGSLPVFNKIRIAQSFVFWVVFWLHFGIFKLLSFPSQYSWFLYSLSATFSRSFVFSM